jgi:hypothetical protein
LHFIDGIEIRIGDKVRFANGEHGEVVFSIDTNEWSLDFPKEHWLHLKKGVMFRTEKGALIFLNDPNQHEVFRLETE